MVQKIILLLIAGVGAATGTLLFGQELAPPDSSAVFAPARQAIATAEGRDSFPIYFDRGRRYWLDRRAYRVYEDQALELAQMLYRQRAYATGVAMLERVEQDLATAAYDRPAEREIDLNYQLARGFYYQRDPPACLARIERGLARLDSTQVAYEKYHNLRALLYLRAENYQLAIDNFAIVLRTRRRLYGEGDNRVASVMNNLGNAYYGLKLLGRTEALYSAGLRIRREVLGPTDFRLYSLLNNLGVVYDEKGAFFQAIETYQSAIDLLEAQSEPHTDELAVVYINLASALSRNGAGQESERYYQRATGLLLEGDAPLRQIHLGDICTNRANRASERGKNTEAIRLQRSGIDHYASELSPESSKWLSARNNLGVYYLESGDYRTALDTLRELERNLLALPERKALYANLCNGLGDTYFGMDSLARATAYQQRALQLQRELYGPVDYRLAYTYNKLARIAQQRGDSAAALAYVEEALRANAAVNAMTAEYRYQRYYLESLLLKARLSDREAALAVYATADRVLAELRSELLDVADRIDFARSVYEVTAGALQVSLGGGDNPGAEDLEQAFYFSERAKANVLSQLLILNQGKDFAGIPADSLRLEEQLQSDLTFYKLQLATATDSTVAARFQRELFTTQTAYRRLMAAFAERYPRYFALKYETRVAQIADVQRAIPADAAVVSYFTGPENLYCLVLTATSARAYRSPVDDRFSNLVTGLRKSIVNRLDTDYPPVARMLYQRLFPFELPAHVEQLIIVPDAALSQLPFEALLRPTDEPIAPGDFSRLPYLIRDYRIRYAPSVSLYLEERRGPPPVFDNDLLAYAPVFAEPQEIAAYETTWQAPLSDQVAVLRSVSEDGGTVAALPGALAEIEQITRVFDRARRRARTYLFERASEATFKQSLAEGHRFIHLATHGFVNREEPDLSGLLFFPDTASAEDHILYSGELYNLPLNADLVVLSACETGLGEAVLGEGLLGLSRAFRYAGARNLLVSLWKVQDQATAELMVDFYEAYWRNPATGSYADPLRAAKLNMIGSGTYSHPFYWSPFVLIGR